MIVACHFCVVVQCGRRDAPQNLRRTQRRDVGTGEGAREIGGERERWGNVRVRAKGETRAHRHAAGSDAGGRAEDGAEEENKEEAGEGVGWRWGGLVETLSGIDGGNGTKLLWEDAPPRARLVAACAGRGKTLGGRRAAVLEGEARAKRRAEKDKASGSCGGSFGKMLCAGV